MKIWSLLYDQDYENFTSMTKESLIFFNRKFRGEKILDYNQEIEIATGFKGKKAQKGERGDIYNLGIIPIFMPRAMNILEPLLKNDIQKIKLKHNVYGECYGINVIRVLDCIDEEKSIIQKMKSGRIFKILKYEFKKEIEYPAIFKTFTDGKMRIFVSENFVRSIEINKLKGVIFNEVWKSE